MVLTSEYMAIQHYDNADVTRFLITINDVDSSPHTTVTKHFLYTVEGYFLFQLINKLPNQNHFYLHVSFTLTLYN